MEEKKKKKQEEKKKKEGAQKKVWPQLLLPCLRLCLIGITAAIPLQNPVSLLSEIRVLNP